MAGRKLTQALENHARLQASPLSEELPPGYKMTELGPLPEEWRVVRLGDLFEIQQGKALSQRARAGPRKRPFLRTANVLWGRIDLSVLDEMHFEEEEEERLALIPGDLLVCEGGDIGRTAIWEGQRSLMLYQNHLYRLRAAREGIAPLFYMYWMQVAWTLLSLYGGTGNKTTIPNLSKSRLAALAVPLPPLPEQRAIADVLRTVQRAKEATERVSAALRELKKSLMRYLFTYGPVPVDQADQVALRETEIGPVPEEWEVVRLGDLVNQGILWMKNGFPQGKHNQSGKGIIHLRPFNINEDGYIDISQKKFVDPPQKSQYWVLPGDVIFNNTNSEELVGKTAYFDLHGNFVISNHMTIIRVVRTEIIETYYLAKYLHQLWRQGLFRKMCRRHVNQASVSLERLKRLSVPLPPLSEQRAIAQILRAVDRKIEAEEARQRALEALFRTLLHDLMTARLRLPPAFIARFAEDAP
jgi:type I restriction enzyme S subunit